MQINKPQKSNARPIFMRLPKYENHGFNWRYPDQCWVDFPDGTHNFVSYPMVEYRCIETDEVFFMATSREKYYGVPLENHMPLWYSFAQYKAALKLLKFMNTGAFAVRLKWRHGVISDLEFHRWKFNTVLHEMSLRIRRGQPYMMSLV